MSGRNFDIGALTQQLGQLQRQADKLAQLQNDSSAPGSPSITTTTYPKIAKPPENVEDILENPSWKNELQAQFANSDGYARAKAIMDTVFLEFCEKETGYKSTSLGEMRKQQADRAPQSEAKLPKKASTSAGTSGTPKGGTEV